jgi:hypothetical protein
LQSFHYSESTGKRVLDFHSCLTNWLVIISSIRLLFGIFAVQTCNMISLKKLLTIGVVICSIGNAFGQSGYMDNALNYSALIKTKTEDGVYKMVGVYKVIGTPFLFGEKNKGDVFSPDTKAYNLQLSYNTYNQEVEFYSTSNPDKPLVKEPGSLDSFILQQNEVVGITTPLKFIYGSFLNSTDKSYFLELYKGNRFSVYKKYKSELGYVSTNYVQSELRQFDLIYDYYYSDSQKPGLKKLKTNSASILKEFKSIKDISPVFTDAEFTVNQESALKKAFEYLNQ